MMGYENSVGAGRDAPPQTGSFGGEWRKGNCPSNPAASFCSREIGCLPGLFLVVSSMMTREKTLGLVEVGTIIGAGICSCLVTYIVMSQNQRSNDDLPDSTMACILKRRSVFPKQYTGERVDKGVIDKMLEAARWAPTHNLTEPWKFVIFSSRRSREELVNVLFSVCFSNVFTPDEFLSFKPKGHFLAAQYKDSCMKSGKQFSEMKFKKKAANVLRSSHCISLICDVHKGKNPVVEDICSVAMAVQNMHLVATAYGVGMC